MVKGRSPVVLSSPDIVTGLTRLCSLRAPPADACFGLLYCNAAAEYTAYVARNCNFVRSAFRDATCDACITYWCEGRWSGTIAAGPHLCLRQCNYLSMYTLGFAFEIERVGKHDLVLATDKTFPGITVLRLEPSYSRDAPGILCACQWEKADAVSIAADLTEIPLVDRVKKSLRLKIQKHAADRRRAEAEKAREQQEAEKAAEVERKKKPSWEPVKKAGEGSSNIEMTRNALSFG